MVEAPGSSSEQQRLQILHRYRALSPTPNPTLDSLARLAATLCDVPIAFVGFFDTDHQVIKASTGWDHNRLHRDWTLCNHLCNQTIGQTEILIIPDLQQQAEFRQHPILRIEPQLRFYAGVPLRSEGLMIGSLGVMDRQPGDLTADQQDGLLSLAGLVITHLNEQKCLHELHQIQRQQEKSDVELRRHALIFAHIHDALLVLDLGGRIIDCNPGATQLFGWTKAELLGKTIQSLHPPTSEKMRSLVVVKAILSEGTWQEQDLFLHRDGSTGTAQIHAVPLQSRGKQTIGILVIYHDISDRRLAELVWEQQKFALQAAERSAHEASQAKGEFLAMISHEIRTPMNAVIGMTELLKETPLSPEQGDFVDTIHTAGEALLTIVNQVLDFSKLESGNIELDFYPFDLAECVENVLDLLAAKALEKGIGLYSHLTEDVPVLVQGDGNRLRQVLLNLLGNALKFTEVGEVRLELSRVEQAELEEIPRSVPHPGLFQPVWIKFAVIDTGIGISPEQQASIFQPYAQAGVSTARTYGGTGLGLNISSRLTVLMGGELQVTSQVGQGSTFFFSIPLQPLEQSLEHPSAFADLGGKRLLIIDGNSVSQNGLVCQSKRWGMIPCPVASLTEALNHLRRGDPIDVVLLDWDLAQVDSFKLAQQMRSLQGYHQLPIILLISLEQERSAEFREPWSQQIEFLGKLPKPVKSKTLKKLFLQSCHPTPNPLRSMSSSPVSYDRSLGQRYPLRILLAEDNLTNQKVISQILYRLGYTSHTVTNGYEVLEQLQQASYDLVLMDLNMPELDGWETTRLIGETYPSDKRPCIVALTAHVLTSVESQCREAGMSGYLTKPIRVPDLIQVLQDTATQRTQGLPPQPAIDIVGLQTFIQDLAGNDWNFLRDLVEAYLQDSDRYLEDLAHYSQDLQPVHQESIQRIIHTLKSSSASIFALPLAELCRQCESNWASYDRSQQQGAIQALIQEYQRARGELQTLIQR